jgi:hypothetical protein
MPDELDGIIARIYIYIYIIILVSKPDELDMPVNI